MMPLIKPSWKNFAYGNADKQGVYYDEENRRHLNSIRMAHSQVAFSLDRCRQKRFCKKYPGTF